jgi:hypothetical protein
MFEDKPWLRYLVQSVGFVGALTAFAMTALYFA